MRLSCIILWMLIDYVFCTLLCLSTNVNLINIIVLEELSEHVIFSGVPIPLWAWGGLFLRPSHPQGRLQDCFVGGPKAMWGEGVWNYDIYGIAPQWPGVLPCLFLKMLFLNMFWQTLLTCTCYFWLVPSIHL